MASSETARAVGAAFCCCRSSLNSGVRSADGAIVDCAIFITAAVYDDIAIGQSSRYGMWSGGIPFPIAGSHVNNSDV